jgi:hypothetical protein
MSLLKLIALFRRRPSESVQSSPLSDPQGSPIPTVGGASPSTPQETLIPTTAGRKDSEDSEDEDAGAALDPSILAQIQARHMTAQALNESLPFQSDGMAEVPCQIVVECRLDSIQEGEMAVQELKEWKKKRVFEAPRVRACQTYHPTNVTR